MSSQTKNDGYTFGYNKSTTASQASRTAEWDAGFLLPHLKPNYRILDFGCGPATISVGLPKYVPDGQVVGVDISSEVLKEAKQNAESLQGGFPANLSFHCVDLLHESTAESTDDSGAQTQIGIPEEWKHSFDVVYASQAFVHLADPITAIKILKTLLKPEGIFATRDFDTGTMTWSPDPTGKLKRWPELMGILVTKSGGAPSIHGGRDMHLHFAEAGFKPEQLTITSSNNVYRLEQRQWWGTANAERFEEGHSIRDGLVKKCGISPEECEEVRKALLGWREDERGMFFVSAIEIIARLQ